MGCDIHSVIQIKPRYRAGWKTVALDVGDNRDYDSFAVYANVRNGSGFAGVDTGEGWKPISEPRGLPEDFTDVERDSESDENSNLVSQWMGDHSWSWLLLSEIEQAWEMLDGQQYELHGIVERKHWEETLAKGQPPKEWCGGITGANITIVDEAIAKESAVGSHVRCAWKLPAHSRLYTMRNHLAIMRAIAEAEQVKPDEVRIVFGFDS
jgi:hypothetical protein